MTKVTKLALTAPAGFKWRWCIHDPDYALRDLAEALNKSGSVTLAIENWRDP